MSARPFVPRLSDEDLDLLLSRSLDGDLSPEEERDLEALLAHDSAAVRRKEELARVVAEARALPEPAPPFALATRVNSNVSEKGGRGGSAFHRFGFYPPPGMAVGAMALLGIVAVAIAVLRPMPLHRVEGPVDVFLTEGGTATKRTQPETPKAASKEAARNETAAASATAERAPAAIVASAPEPKLKNDLEGNPGENAADAEKADSRKKLAEKAPASSVVSNEPAPAPSLDAVAKQAAGAAAPAAKASEAHASTRPQRSWSVVVRGEGARRWMLRRAPEGRPSVASTQVSTFRIALDAEGRVTSVRALDPAPVPPALFEFVRGLVFEPVAAVADGTRRDEKAKDERAGALRERTAEYASEIDVEISTR